MPFSLLQIFPIRHWFMNAYFAWSNAATDHVIWCKLDRCGSGVSTQRFAHSILLEKYEIMENRTIYLHNLIARTHPLASAQQSRLLFCCRKDKHVWLVRAPAAQCVRRISPARTVVLLYNLMSAVLRSHTRPSHGVVKEIEWEKPRRAGISVDWELPHGFESPRIIEYFHRKIPFGWKIAHFPLSKHLCDGSQHEQLT